MSQNLILLHSFPTNSILLAGLLEYLGEFYTVHMLDLPGFTRASPPLDDISHAGFSAYVAAEIERLNLPHYVLGGISYGFHIVNQLDPPDACRGILALEPYTGRESLRMSAGQRVGLPVLLNAILGLRLHNVLWRSPAIRGWLIKLRNYPPDAVNVMLREIDARTYFATALGILRLHDSHTFHPRLPYVLLANPADHVVNYAYLRAKFERHVPRLLVEDIDIEHFPPEFSRDYIAGRIPPALVQRVVDFLR